MGRLFLDANVLFSAAYRSDSGLRRLWKINSVKLCSSRYALEEARFNLSEEGQQSRLDELSRSLEFFEAQGDLSSAIFLPEKDAPIFLAALRAEATHLLTGDIRHFGRYFGRKAGGILVLLPGEYLRQQDRR